MGLPGARPLRSGPQACRRIGRDHHAISERVGGRVGLTGRRPPSRSLGRRAVPARRGGSCSRACARDRPTASARRRPRRDRRGRQGAVDRVEGALCADARARARALREAAHARLRHRAPPPPGRRARGDADRADRRDAEDANGNGNGNGHATSPRRGRRARGRARARRRGVDEELPSRSGREDPGAIRRYRFRHPTASGKTIAAGGLRRVGAHRGRPDPHAPPAARRSVPPRAHRARVRRSRFTDAILDGAHGCASANPITIQTYAWFARHVGEIARDAYQLVICDEAHTALGEKTSAAIRSPRRAGLHRHDRDRGADREAGVRRVPGVGRRPAAGRRCAARPDRAASQPARAAGRRDQPGADRRRRLRGARTCAGTRPRGAQHGRCDALPRAVRRHAGRRLRSRRRPRLQPRDRVPRGRDQGGGGVGADAAGEAGGDPRRLRARRDRRADQRDAARRRLELTARDRHHAPRADGVEARLPAADRPDHAHPSAQGGGHRRRLHAEGGDAQRARRLAALAARRRLLPRGRARDAGAAPA